MPTCRHRGHVDEHGVLHVELPRELAGADVEITVVRDDDEEHGTPSSGAVTHDVFLELVRSAPLHRGDVLQAFAAIDEAAARALGVERASVWLYDGRRTKLEQRDLYLGTSDAHTSGVELLEHDYPRYFAAMDQDEVIAAHDAHKDARTAEFSQTYLAPLGITSMLDAPITLRGQTIGVLCLEHVGARRRWTSEERSAAMYLASMASLALEIAERKRAESASERSLSLLLTTLEATADGILAVDRDARIVRFNSRFVDMWNMPDAVLISTVKGERLRFLAAQTLDPAGYIKRATELFEDPDAEGYDMFELTDGRVFERHSRPQYMGIEPIGRVWSYRDITERVLVEKELSREREKADRLLHNILPAAIVERLKQSPAAIADSFDDATVLFADIVGFTRLSAAVSPEGLVGLLNDIFSEFDLLAERHGVEKIKTIGDNYMAAAGVPTPRPDHAEAAAALALDMRDCIARIASARDAQIQIRIGLHSGPVVAGVIGIKRFIYDLWGDTVNTASRMESHGIAGGIQLSEAARSRIGPSFLTEDRGELHVKGKGAMRTYLLTGRAPSPAG